VNRVLTKDLKRAPRLIFFRVPARSGARFARDGCRSSRSERQPTAHDLVRAAFDMLQGEVRYRGEAARSTPDFAAQLPLALALAAASRSAAAVASIFSLCRREASLERQASSSRPSRDDRTYWRSEYQRKLGGAGEEALSTLMKVSERSPARLRTMRWMPEYAPSDAPARERPGLVRCSDLLIEAPEIVRGGVSHARLPGASGAKIGSYVRTGVTVAGGPPSLRSGGCLRRSRY
jgi:hypothetical protein